MVLPWWHDLFAARSAHGGDDLVYGPLRRTRSHEMNSHDQSNRDERCIPNLRFYACSPCSCFTANMHRLRRSQVVEGKPGSRGCQPESIVLGRPAPAPRPFLEKAWRAKAELPVDHQLVLTRSTSGRECWGGALFRNSQIAAIMIGSSVRSTWSRTARTRSGPTS